MHIHILGICGTFMAGIASLARALGHRVTGSDAEAYPPMSDQLASQGIEVMRGYAPAHLDPPPDWVVVGNALSRGNPALEYVLDQNLAYTSGPAWLAEQVLRGRWTMAVAGTHGKTTTASMLAWILEYAGHSPGFLIGGVPENFGVSARLGKSSFFVLEADEYDTAFFDKRSKFIHYRPKTLVINNLEYDHADIFPDLAAIERQFHHLVRTVPGRGLIVQGTTDESIERVLAMGCWTPVQRSGDPGGAGWQARLLVPDGSHFEVWEGEKQWGTVRWPLLGEHNVRNALAALLAARHAGVPEPQACEALGHFRSVKRRLEERACIRGIRVYDDFAHHPTAIATTLRGLRRRVGEGRILAILEPRSNTMRLGVHRDTLAPSLAEADLLWLFWPPEVTWDLQPVVAAFGSRGRLCRGVDTIVAEVAAAARSGDHVLIMSNGGFGGIHERLIQALAGKPDAAHG
jgi:UDP-N-acetylmuramate: L-alanyl-gamma-D-glutamyl-meso-diaminopimelate ligase